MKSMERVQPDFKRKRNGWFIATFLPHLQQPMRQHMFQMNQYHTGLYETIIEEMMMRPLNYGLESIMTTEEIVTYNDFFANYRIFRVESTYASCYQHAEITKQDLETAPVQDILIAHVDELPGAKNELLLQYQVRSVDVQSQGSSGSGLQDATNRYAVHNPLTSLLQQLTDLTSQQPSHTIHN